MTGYQWASLVLTAINIIVLPLFGWLMKNAMARYTDKIERLEARMEKVEADIETKVGEEEWIRESMELRGDVKVMGQTLARIEGKTDSTLMLAGSVNRVAAAIEKNQEAAGA